jgi:hypothetical protein
MHTLPLLRDEMPLTIDHNWSSRSKKQILAAFINRKHRLTKTHLLRGCAQLFCRYAACHAPTIEFCGHDGV